MMSIHLTGDYLKMHIAYVDRNEEDYADYNYLNFLLKMKLSIQDETFTPNTDDNDYFYRSKDGEELRQSQNTFHYFDCVTHGQLYRFN